MGLQRQSDHRVRFYMDRSLTKHAAITDKGSGRTISSLLQFKWFYSSMPRDPLIGLVGKPSSGKSTTLNRFVTLERPDSKYSSHSSFRSLTDASSKVGMSRTTLRTRESTILMLDVRELPVRLCHYIGTLRLMSLQLHHYRPPASHRLPTNPVRVRTLQRNRQMQAQLWSLR